MEGVISHDFEQRPTLGRRWLKAREPPGRLIRKGNALP
jgi:hypothetical protein